MTKASQGACTATTPMNHDLTDVNSAALLHEGGQADKSQSRVGS